MYRIVDTLECLNILIDVFACVLNDLYVVFLYIYVGVRVHLLRMFFPESVRKRKLC